MTILHTECVRDCGGQPFDFANRGVAGCDDIPVLAAGANVTITGTGTVADPLVVAANPPAADGSETVIVAGANASITGSGTAADPYVVAASGPGAAPDGSETIVTAGANVTVTGTGTAADPYVVSAAAGATADGSETIVTAGLHTTVAGTGTAADPYVIGSDSPRFPQATGGATFSGQTPAAGVVFAQIGPVSLVNPSATETMSVEVAVENRDIVATSNGPGAVGIEAQISLDAGVTWNTLGLAYATPTGAGQVASLPITAFVRPHAVPAGGTVNVWTRLRGIVNNSNSTVNGGQVISLFGRTFING